MLRTKNRLLILFSIITMLSAFGFTSTGRNVLNSNIKLENGKKHKKIVVKTVLLKNISFKPKIITIKSGTKVKWINKDTAMHTVISGTPKKDSGVFESKNMGLGSTFEFTFKKKGIYKYFCGTHPTLMKAIVIVK